MRESFLIDIKFHNKLKMGLPRKEYLLYVSIGCYWIPVTENLTPKGFDSKEIYYVAHTSSEVGSIIVKE